MSEEKNTDRSERRKRRKKKKQLPFGCSSHTAAAAAIFLVVCAVVLVVVKWNVLSPDSIERSASFSDSEKNNASVDITGSGVFERNFHNVDSGLVYISDTSVVKLSHDCERIMSEKHSYTDPMIKSSKIYSIAFGEGSGSFCIIHGDKKVYEGSQGSAITDCDINDEGTYCVLSDKTGYLSCLSVYSKNNEFVYSYSFSDFYAVSVSVSSDSRTIAVGTMNSSDGRLVSKVYLLDVTKSEPIKTFTYEDQLIYEVRFVTDENVAVVTDTLTTVLKRDGSKEIPYIYSSQILTAYDTCFDGNIVLSLSKSDDGRNCSIVTLNSDGAEVGLFSTDLKVVSIDAAPDRAAVLSYGKLGIYNAYGDKFGEWDVGTDSRSVLLPENKTAYILGVSGITKVSLKY